MLDSAARCWGTFFTTCILGLHPSMLCLSPAGLLWELVSRLLHLHFKDDKTKVSGDALQLMVELLKVFVVEAAVRGVRQAQAEDALRVDVDQLEKVLPQLLLDF
ncbi:centromere protein X isoform X8 [Gorilla gorilla gorilla]|uniref:centromere protein X isoform X8 n=1 Tax=Gorilla gorilla gorilla TaxID=9595 RepID=UPI0008F52B4D|nr:centromere protein X isoform X7 [Gorilla gorilla gorilla]